jgi:hypothetical protein
MTVETFLILLPIAYVALQWSALQRMRDRWLWAAVLPVMLMAVALAVFIVGMLTNASMTTLWLMLGLPVATLYLVLLLPIHWIVARED